MNSDLISSSTQKLQQYIEGEKYRGYDPYDGLKSPLFKIPFLEKNKTIRFLFQQFVKRFPFNIRPLLGIKKSINPATLGLCVQAYANLVSVFPEKKKEYEDKIAQLVDELEKLIPAGFKGAGWGYDFDWESRFAKIPAYQPNLVTTGFITNALFHAYTVTGNKKALVLCISASDFVLKDINKTFDDQNRNFCFSYSPFDREVVFNASMKGVRILAQVYSLTKDEKLKEEARKAVEFVTKMQEGNGSWIYSMSSVGNWIDNYHTGYILDCLDEYIRCTGDSAFEASLGKGYDFYRNTFFTKEGIPKFYDKEMYPVDCTAAAQSLLTLTRFNETEKAEQVAEWMIQNMQSKSGYFYFRKFKSYTMKTSFMRWSNAWMFLGLTELLASQKKSTG